MIRREKQSVYISMCIIYNPNLGLVVAVFVLEREHGRFRGSTERGGSSKGTAAREQRIPALCTSAIIA